MYTETQLQLALAKHKYTGLSKVWAQELIAEIPKFQSEDGGMAFWKPDRRTMDGTEAFPSYYTAKAQATAMAMAIYVLAQEYDNMVGTFKFYLRQGNKESSVVNIQVQ